MKTYLILKKLRGGFRIRDIDCNTETEKVKLEQETKEAMLFKIRKNWESYHPVTRKYGEVSDITFSEVEKLRDYFIFADNYYLNGIYSMRTNKLLLVLDVIVERYNRIKKWGIKSLHPISLVNDLIDVFNTNLEELERIALLQTEEESK